MPKSVKNKNKSNNKDSTILHINATVNQQNDNSSAHPARGSNNAQANPPNNIDGNYHSDLGANQNMQSVDAQNNLNQSDGDVNYHDQSVGEFSKHDEKSKHKLKKKVTVIAGDSMLKHLQGWKLFDINNHVVVKSFADTTINDMEDYLKPVIRKEPETIVHHIGANDLRNLSPKQVAEGITNLGSQINEESPNTNIVISSILIRTDNSQLAVKATEANKLLSATWSKNRWKFINHKSINRSCLNTRGLHLNRKGSSVIADNFSKFICTHNRILPLGSRQI